MKKVILLFAVAAALSACGGGGGDNGTGSVAGVPPEPRLEGQGDTFVTAVSTVIGAGMADMIGFDASQATYDSYAETTSDFTLPDTLV